MESIIRKNVIAALWEDQSQRDITTNILVKKDQTSEAFIVAKERAVACGFDVVKAVFQRLDPQVELKLLVREGETVRKGKRILSLKGRTKALLSGERVALNFLAYLSGVATETSRFVKRVYPYDVKIMDTRKTIPGLRGLVKMAVRAGGGVNHRFDLKEMVMIKDNHFIAYGAQRSIHESIQQIRRRTKKRIVVEVDTLNQFKEALEAQPDVILLDNMKPEQLRKAVHLNHASPRPCLLEASGGITLRTIRRVAKTGIDRISIGALTHSSKAIDFSMEFIA